MTDGAEFTPAARMRDPLSEIRFKFLGKVLATFSHELKNHLAVIRESNGLVGDLVEMEKPPQGEGRGLYRSAVEAVDRQILRTLSLIQHFNRFSHRMDSFVSAFRPGEVIEELLTLIQRLASQRRISFGTDFRKGPGEVVGNPALLQLVVFCLLETLVKEAPEGTVLTLRTSVEAGLARIDILAAGSASRSTEEAFCTPEEVRGLLDELGGGIERQGNGWRLAFPVDKGAQNGVNYHREDPSG